MTNAVTVGKSQSNGYGIAPLSESGSQSMEQSKILKLDDASIIQQSNGILKQPTTLKQSFIDQYGVTLKLPSNPYLINFIAYYILGARFYPPDPSYMLSWENHAYPHDLQVYNLDEKGASQRDYEFEREKHTQKYKIILRKQQKGLGYLSVKEHVFPEKMSGNFKFSYSGNYFLMAGKQPTSMFVYDSSDIVKLIDLIKEKKSIKRIDDSDLKELRKISFSPDDRIMTLAFDSRIKFYFLSDTEAVTPYKIIDIPIIYELTVTLRISNDGDDGMLVVKRKDYRNCDILKLDMSYVGTIRYSTEGTLDLRAKINRGLTKVFLNNNTDNLIWEDGKQEIVRSFYDKTVYRMITHKDGFIGVSNNHYDTHVDLLHTHDPKFSYKIFRKCTPGNTKFLDLRLEGEVLKLLSVRDGEFFQDSIDMTNGQKSSFYYSEFKTTSFQWPYIGYIQEMRSIVIHDLFENKKVYKITPQNQDEQCASYFITENMDLFYAIFHKGEIRLYCIDMDDLKLNPTPFFTYHYDQVNNVPLTAMYARSSSQKNTVPMNYVAVVFLVHGTKLYELYDGQLTFRYDIDRIQMFDNNNFFFNTYVEGSKLRKGIYQISVTYSSSTINQVYTEKDPKCDILNFGISNEKILYVLIRKKIDAVRKYYFFKIIDPNTKKVLHTFQPQSKEIIGQMKAGNVYFINGNFYFKNEMIRLNPDSKLDLMHTKYENIIDLKPSESMNYNSPIPSFEYSKILYFKKDQTNNSPKVAIILPFIDERSIKLNKQLRITQFWTILKDEQVGPSNQKLLCIVSHFLKFVQNLHQDRYYTYSIKGQLIKYESFKQLAKDQELFEALDASHNGINIIYRSEDQNKYSIVQFSDQVMPQIMVQYDINQKIQSQQDILDKLDSIGIPNIKVLFDRFKVIKTEINDRLDMAIYLEENENKLKSIFFNNKKTLENILGKEYEKVKSENDANQEESIEVRKKIIIYIPFMSSGYGQSSIQILTNQDILKSIRAFRNFRMSQEHLFFWDRKQVYKYNLEKRLLSKIGFNIPITDEILKQTYIKSVQVSGLNDKDTEIVITVIINENSSELIIWDIKKDIEDDSYDVGSNSQVMFDHNGEIYVVDNGHMLINKTGCVTYSYKFNLDKIDEKYIFQGFDKGYRVDPVYKNYALLRNYLSIGCSYLTMVYQQQFEKSQQLNHKNFDYEGFNYIVAGKTDLHDLAENFKQLEYVLNRYSEEAPHLLDQLLFTNENNKTPLHITVENTNYRSVNLILEKLANMNVSNSESIKDLFESLLEFVSFGKYLDKMFFQTDQMKSIQTMKVKKSADPNSLVFEIQDSFIDSEFYEKVSGNSSSVNQPVVIKAIDINWILNEKMGQDFLRALGNTENVEFYNSEGVRVLISYLWKHYKHKIQMMIFIPYCIYFGLFLAMTFYNEKYFQKMLDENETAEDLRKGAITLCSLTAVAIAYFLGILILQIYSLKEYFYKTKWLYMFFTSHCLNITLIVMILSHNEENENQVYNIRRIEAANSVLMWLQYFYFFRSIEATAALVRMVEEIIFDMKSFMIIFFLVIFAFANGYYFISKNQDALITDPEIDVPYNSVLKSMRYTYRLALGDFGVDDYNLGGDEHYLWALFFLGSFFLSIVLLNMLIAIMGTTFSRVEGTAEANMLRERLSLIIENSFLPKISNVAKAKYLVQVNPVTSEATTDEVIQEIKAEILEQRGSVAKVLEYVNENQDEIDATKENFNKLFSQIQDMQMKLDKLVVGK